MRAPASDQSAPEARPLPRVSTSGLWWCARARPGTEALDVGERACHWQQQNPRICARFARSVLSRARLALHCPEDGRAESSCSSRSSAMALLPRPFDVSATPPHAPSRPSARHAGRAGSSDSFRVRRGLARGWRLSISTPGQQGDERVAPSYCLPTSSSRSFTRGVVVTRRVGRRRVTPVHTTRTVWRAPLLDVTGGATLDATVRTAG
jgi:hypothetical protein